MAQFDANPLYRTLVGFDRLANLIDQAARYESAPGYPPYNIEKLGEDQFRIEIAVAGFKDEELVIELKDQTLFVSGRKQPVEDGRTFLHRGIAERSFERRFQLADHVLVTDAALENGLLVIKLVRELPEASKPRRIAIKTHAAEAPKVVDATVGPKAA